MNAGNITVVPNAGDAAALAQVWGACPRWATPATR